MPVLSNKTFNGPITNNAGNSFGPFISLDEENFRFDTQIREFSIWLGHQPSPMFGVLQHLETWSAEWTDEMLQVKRAYLELMERTSKSLCGQLNLNPLEGEGGSPPLKPAAMLYQYIALSILDQYSDQHQALAGRIEQNFAGLVKRYGAELANPYVSGANFEFGFEFTDTGLAEQFRSSLAKAGIMNKPVLRTWPLPLRWLDNPIAPAVENSLITNRFLFQLNFAYRDHFLDLFWERLRQVFENYLDESFEYQTVEIDCPSDQKPLYEFHQLLIEAKATGKLPQGLTAAKFLESQLGNYPQNLTPVVVARNNYSGFRDRILAMQEAVYEPVRRSPPEEFDMLFESENPLAIIVLNGQEIAAMMFAGRLSLFAQERGISSDPHRTDPSVYYSMDLTIAPEFRGGLGSKMKQAQLLLAIENGVSAIHGRNRDRLAAGMWAINLSLGAYQLQHLIDDYPDGQQHRDCIYYRCPLKWPAVGKSDREKFYARGMIDGTDLKNTTIGSE